MDYLNISTYLFAFTLIFGAIFLSQCQEDVQNLDDDRTETREQQGIQEDQEANEDEYRRYDEGRGNTETGDQQDQTLTFEEDRDIMISNMEELRDDLDEELEEISGDTDEENGTYEQIENHRNELDRLIEEAEASSEDDWIVVRTEAQQTYERIAAQHDERRN